MITPASYTLVAYKGSTFGPVRFIAYADVEHTTTVDLTGYTAHMKVRERANGPVVYDLVPTITDGPGGEITAPAVSDEITKGSAFPRGTYVWDLMLEKPSGAVVGPFIEGPFLTKLPVSRA